MGFRDSGSSSSSSRSTVWDPQAKYLEDLWGKAKTQSEQGGGINPYLQQALDGLFPGSASPGARGAHGLVAPGSVPRPTGAAPGYGSPAAAAGPGWRPAAGPAPESGGGGGGPAAPNPLSEYATSASSGLGALQGLLGGSSFNGRNLTGPGVASSQQLDATAAGDFLGGNPTLDNTFDRAAGRLGQNFSEYVLPGVNATFGGGGRTNSPAHERAISNAGQGYGQSLSDLSASIYGPAYEAERGRQFSAGSQQAGFQDTSLGRDFRAAQAGEDRRFQAAQGDANRRLQAGTALGGFGLSAAQMAQQASQFGSSQGAASDRFSQSLAERQRQFDANFGEGGRQFDANFGLQQSQTQFGAGQYVQNLPNQNLQNYKDIVGPPVMDTRSQSQGKQQQGWGGALGGLFGGLGGLFGGVGGG